MPGGPVLVRALVAGVLLAGPTVLAFATGGFFDTPRTVAAIAAWAGVLLLALFGAPAPPGRPAWLALAGLAGLTVWAALSTSWAPLLEPARDDVSRLVGYTGALAAGALVWHRRSDARLVEPLLAAGTLVVVGYGLAGRLLPGVIELDRSGTAAGRLEQPLTYWNAMGALAAIGLTLAIRVAGDSTRTARLRAAAAAVAPVLGLGVYLSFSRGAIAALAVGLLVLAALMPDRAQLRAGALALAAGLVVVGVANLLPGVESLSGSSPDRDGLIGLAALVAVAAAAALLQLRAARADDARAAPPRRFALPRGAAVAAVVVAVLVGAPLLAVVLEHGAASEPAPPGAGAGRLTDIGSNRYDYWDVALESFADHPYRGTGIAGFRADWLREREIDETVQDAHSLYLETAAELGLVGLALLGLLFGGVAIGARRAVRRDRALAAGWAAGLVVFAVHASLDWDWEMPAVSYPALVIGGAVLAQARTVRPAAGSED